jgi:small conductance mechanosensitive channel
MEAINNLVIVYGLKICLALAIFFIGKFIASKITKFVIKLIEKSNRFDSTLTTFLHSVIYGFLLIVVIIAALSQAGVETTSFIAILGAAGLAIGLAFKDTLSNISSGIIIIIFEPFKIGEFIEAAGTSGTVEQINIFQTILKTADNKLIIVGNTEMIKSNIVNFTRTPTRRLEIVFGISYDDNIKLAKDVILEVINSDSRILKEPKEPIVVVRELADNSVNLMLRVWVLNGDYWDVNFDTLEQVKLAFDKNNITIPYPQLEMHNIK